MNRDDDLSGTTIEKYRIIEKIGRGSFGAVYRVFDMILQTEKAIKILDFDEPEKALMIFKEAEIPYKCRHKNIVAINDANLFYVQDKLMIIIDMELVNDGSLENLLANGFVPILDGLNLLSNSLYGLEHAHLNKIVHRDIKPANILINNGVPKISDFGLAVPEGTEITPWVWYKTHAAPEVFQEQSVATISSDIYAFGMTLYRTVNNIADWRKFMGKIDNADSLRRTGKLIDKLPFEPFVPSKVKQIVKKACKVKPEERYQSAAELRNAIDRLQCRYKWSPISPTTWEGVSFKKCDEKLEASIVVSKQKNEFILKKNNRCVHALKQAFDCEADAMQYMHGYIANHTIE